MLVFVQYQEFKQSGYYNLLTLLQLKIRLPFPISLSRWSHSWYPVIPILPWESCFWVPSQCAFWLAQKTDVEAEHIKIKISPECVSNKFVTTCNLGRYSQVQQKTSLIQKSFPAKFNSLLQRTEIVDLSKKKSLDFYRISLKHFFLARLSEKADIRWLKHLKKTA